MKDDLKSQQRQPQQLHKDDETRIAFDFLNRLDELDKFLSRPFFRAKLPLMVEYALSVPGNFFGVPIVTLLLTPSLMAFYYTKETPSMGWLLLLAFLTGIIIVLWAFVLQGNTQAIRIFYGPTLGAVTPLLGVSLLNLLEDDAKRVGYFQIAAWCISVIPVAVLKPLMSRLRPCCCGVQQEETTNDKHLSILPHLFARDGRASFPSGDAAGAMAVMYSLIRISSHGAGESGGGGMIKDHVGFWMGISGVFLSMTGRMYWQAHHFGDVLVGASLALLCCFVLDQYLIISSNSNNNNINMTVECCHAELWQALAMHAALIVTVIASRMWFKVRIFQSGTISTEEKKKKY